MNKLLSQTNDLLCHQTDMPSFVFTTQPEPGEGVPDLLMRAAYENGFHSLRAVNLMMGCLESLPWSHSAMTRRQIDPVAIARILGLNVDQIQQRLYGRVSEPVSFFGARISPFILGRARRISPSFLKKRGYQKALWGLRCFSFDPETREELIDRCVCRSPLTFERTASLIVCRDCGADLREIPSPKVNITDEAALEFCLSLIDPCADRSKHWNVDEGLSRFSRGEIFTLVVESAKLLNLQMTDRKNAIMGDSHNIPDTSLMEAARCVLDWPNAFFEMAISIEDSRLTSYTRMKTHPLVTSIPRKFPELRRFLRKELNTLFGKGGRVRFRYPNTTLTNVEQPPLFYSKSVKSHAKLLGLPICEVLNLYQVGAIQCPERSLGLMLKAPETAPELDLVSFKMNERSGEKGLGLPVFDLVHSCRDARHPWAIVFQNILNGGIKVTWWPSKGRSNWFSKCLFTTDEARVREICKLRESALNPDTEISIDDLLFYFRMSRDSRAILRGTGLIPRGRLTLDVLWELQTRYMTFQDISSRLLVAGMRQFPVDLAQKLDQSSLRRIVPEVRIYEREEADAFLHAFLPEKPCV